MAPKKLRFEYFRSICVGSDLHHQHPAGRSPFVLVESSSTTSRPNASMKRESDVVRFLHAAAAICLLNFNLSVGAIPTACAPHARWHPFSATSWPQLSCGTFGRLFFLKSENLTLHFAAGGVQHAEASSVVQERSCASNAESQRFV